MVSEHLLPFQCDRIVPSSWKVAWQQSWGTLNTRRSGLHSKQIPSCDLLSTVNGSWRSSHLGAFLRLEMSPLCHMDPSDFFLRFWHGMKWSTCSLLNMSSLFSTQVLCWHLHGLGILVTIHIHDTKIYIHSQLIKSATEDRMKPSFVRAWVPLWQSNSDIISGKPNTHTQLRRLKCINRNFESLWLLISW